MARALSNKALIVLEVLRECGESTCNDIAAAVNDRMPPCVTCDGTGEGDASYGCRRCFGRGRPYFHYSDAYVALKALRARGLVRRRYLMDEWGDPTRTLVYFADSPPDASADDLEALYALPSHPERAS